MNWTMHCDIVIREAEPQDLEARIQLIKHGLTSYDKDAFFFFFLQEVTLQAALLAAAVLFIFGGVTPAALPLVPLALGAAVALGVRLAHCAAARALAQELPFELAGFVAELRAPAPLVVGTLSVERCRRAPRRAWLRALAVRAAWRRRGVARALLAAAAARAAAERLRELRLAASALQAPARSLLRAGGWRERAAYHRRLLGAVLTLPMVHMALDLPAGPADPDAHTADDRSQIFSY